MKKKQKKKKLWAESAGLLLSVIVHVFKRALSAKFENNGCLSWFIAEFG